MCVCVYVHMCVFIFRYIYKWKHQLQWTCVHLICLYPLKQSLDQLHSIPVCTLPNTQSLEFVAETWILAKLKIENRWKKFFCGKKK